MPDLVLWMILALLLVVLPVCLWELVTGRSCDDNDTSSPVRVRLLALLPVGGVLLVLAKVSRALLDPAPGSAAAGGFAVLSGLAVIVVVAGLLARAWVSRRDPRSGTGPGQTHTGAAHEPEPSR